MKELIKIVEQDSRQLVDARDLFKAIGTTYQFINWIDNHIKRFGLVEDEDFFPRSGKSTGGRSSKEYDLTITAAAAIVASQNDENGFKLLKYLMKVDEAWNTPEKVIARAKQAGALILTEESVLALKHLAAGMALSPFPGALANGIPSSAERILTEKDTGRVYMLVYAGATKQCMILVYNHEGKFLDVALAHRDKWGHITQVVKDSLERKHLNLLGRWGAREKVQYDDFFRWKASLIEAGVTNPALPPPKVMTQEQINTAANPKVLSFDPRKATYINDDEESGIAT